jgi:hypothetical protein
MEIDDLNVRKKEFSVLVISLIIFLFASFYFVGAAPQGATIQYNNSGDTGPVRSPGNLTHPGGRIVTVVLNSEQQDAGWKAYVGNVSGLYVLQNALTQSIYEWPVSSVGGAVYMSRNSSINFGVIGCAAASVIGSENTFLGYTGIESDSINKTFNSTAHRGFSVGTTPIANNTCPSTALWVNDSIQSQIGTATWQELLLNSSSTLVYTALINNAKYGFNALTYDFQAIIPENKTSAVGTTYYFYVELG